MPRRSILASIFMSVIAWSAVSGATAYAAPKEAGAEEEASEKEIAKSVDFDGLVFPIFIDRKLINYMFVSARMKVASGKSTWEYREQAHKIRDGIIRAAHRDSLHKGDDPNTLDKDKARKILLEAANEAVGETDALVDMTFLRVDSKLDF